MSQQGDDAPLPKQRLVIYLPFSLFRVQDNWTMQPFSYRHNPETKKEFIQSI